MVRMGLGIHTPVKTLRWHDSTLANHTRLAACDSSLMTGYARKRLATWQTELNRKKEQSVPNA